MYVVSFIYERQGQKRYRTYNRKYYVTATGADEALNKVLKIVKRKDKIIVKRQFEYTYKYTKVTELDNKKINKMLDKCLK